MTGSLRSRVEVREGSSGFGFRRQLLVLLGPVLYDLFGAPHIVFCVACVVCWCAHKAVYPRLSSLKG
jgi:hypothetical protein